MSAPHRHHPHPEAFRLALAALLAVGTEHDGAQCAADVAALTAECDPTTVVSALRLQSHTVAGLLGPSAFEEMAPMLRAVLAESAAVHDETG